MQVRPQKHYTGRLSWILQLCYEDGKQNDNTEKWRLEKDVLIYNALDCMIYQPLVSSDKTTSEEGCNKMLDFESHIDEEAVLLE